MTARLDIISALLAALLCVVFFTYLSEATAGLVLRCWVLFAPLCLMAFLENERRGLTRRAGGLPPRRLAVLAVRAAAVGLFFASFAVVFVVSSFVVSSA